jgi:hypothetical protein
MKIVPDSPGEGVILNNPSPAKKLTQLSSRKNHFFTFFYKDSSEIPNIVAELKRFAYKGKIQTEVSPTTGKQHLQGSIWCKLRHRDTEFKTLKGAHFETLKDVDDVSNYCNKDETHDGIYRVAWGFPEPKYIESIPDEKLYDWELDILTKLKLEPDKRSLYWYWEPDGCTGKTTFQKYLFSNFEGVVVLSGKACDMKNGIINYQERNKSLPKIVLINIPRSSIDFVSYTGLEEIKDMFFFSGKYEGGMVCGASPHVFIFANEEPDKTKMSSDRFKVHRINIYNTIMVSK